MAMEMNTLCGLPVSRLGMGNMRLPSVGEGPEARIDIPEAEKVICRAYESGINYFDTAYPYHGGESETVVGQVMERFPRESFYLATKMPGHRGGYVQRMTPTEIFEDQLRKCRTEYFDFYLLHNVAENSIDTYMDEKLGIVEALLRQKEKGRIRHLGFSSHAGLAALEKFLDWRPGTFEFVQLQINYLDWTYQDAKARYDAVTGRGLPLIIMEPVRGGSLARLRQEFAQILAAADPNRSQAAWALDWVRHLDNARVILSGMHTPDQVTENAATFSRPVEFTEEQRIALDKVVNGMRNFVPCTGCRYCCEGCPMELDIPRLLSSYFEVAVAGNFMARRGAMALGDKGPGACIGCGQCTEACPQNIEVPQMLADFAKILAE